MKPEEPRREGRIFPRGKRGILWIAWYDGKGEHRETTGSSDPRVADRRLAKRLSEKHDGKVYHPTAKRLTLGDLVAMLREHHEGKGTKSWRRLEQCTRHLVAHFGADERAADITHRKLKGYVKARRRDPKRLAKPATIRLELSVLAQAFKVAREDDLLAAAPVFPTVTVKNVRTTHFTDGEFAKLMAHLPPPVAAVAEFAGLTGWRKEEVLGLRWRAVDVGAGTVRLEPGQTKNGRGRVFPFGKAPRLAALMERQRQERWRIERERGMEVTHVFHRDGRPIRDVDDIWRAACKAAGVPGRWFHDLRRYAAMRLVRAGVARSEAMQLLGHETENMFVRYAINDVPMLERAVEKLAALDSPSHQST
jgi:integrase